MIGWFQGRMEFGPRALGCRSIIGDPRNSDDADDDEPEGEVPRGLPAVRAVRAAGARARVFRHAAGRGQPVHAAGAPVQRGAPPAARPDGQSARTGIDKLKAQRSDVPAVTHVDYSARIQTVDAERHGLFRRLIERSTEDRLPGDRQHQLQSGLGSDRQSPRGGVSTRSWRRTSTCCAWGTACSRRQRSGQPRGAVARAGADGAQPMPRRELAAVVLPVRARASFDAAAPARVCTGCGKTFHAARTASGSCSGRTRRSTTATSPRS